MSKQASRDSIQDIAEYYRNNSEETRFEKQQLEFQVTRRILKKSLTPPLHILELGAGTGRYTFELLQQGHQVTALELVPELTKFNQERVTKAGLQARAKFLTGDARDFLKQADGPYDAAVVMGPLYHLVQSEERQQLMTDLFQALKPEGILITAHLTRVGLIGYMLTRFPQSASEGTDQLQDILKNGAVVDHPRNGDFRGYFTEVHEIATLHQAHGFDVMQIYSQDPCIGSVDEIFNRLPEDLKENWAELLTNLSHDPMAHGSGRSLLCVSKKMQ